LIPWVLPWYVCGQVCAFYEADSVVIMCSVIILATFRVLFLQHLYLSLEGLKPSSLVVRFSKNLSMCALELFAEEFLLLFACLLLYFLFMIIVFV